MVFSSTHLRTLTIGAVIAALTLLSSCSPSTGQPGDPGSAGVDRWRTDARARRVVLYRVPIERLAHLHRDDEWHRRSYIESCVFRAVAELLGKDPWDIAPERYRHF